MKAILKNTITALIRRLLALRYLLEQAPTRSFQECVEQQEELTIREVVINDIPALAELYILACAKTSWNIKEPSKAKQRALIPQKQLEMIEGSCFFLVVENIQGKLVGFAKGKRYNREELSICSGELTKLYLLSAYNGMGLEAKLIDAAAQKILGMGLS
ncbi:MAG: family N-acetyltransferase [Chitinophagaceae bacterium]|nr:family N-acetyltransferase [Chitinophagaceae bacterium]